MEDKKIMTPILINAKSMKEEILAELQDEVKLLKQLTDGQPTLTIIKATEDKACDAYIRNKKKIGEEVGVQVKIIELPPSITQEEMVLRLSELKFKTEQNNAIILQQPIYSHLEVEPLIDLIDSIQDADCFSTFNLGKLIQQESTVAPCTPKGVIDILKYHGIDIAGKRITVIGRSVHVGLSLSIMLTQMGGIVTTTHSKSPNLQEDVQKADIVISCVGKRNLIQPHWMKKDSVLIGVGITYENGKQYTDYDIDSMLQESQCLLVGDRVNCTGTSTVLNLIKNTINLFKVQNNFNTDSLETLKHSLKEKK